MDEAEKRFVGMTEANINLEVGDEDVKKFALEYVSDEIDENQIAIVRDKKIGKLDARTIRTAISKITSLSVKSTTGTHLN